MDALLHKPCAEQGGGDWWAGAATPQSIRVAVKGLFGDEVELVSLDVKESDRFGGVPLVATDLGCAEFTKTGGLGIETIGAEVEVDVALQCRLGFRPAKVQRDRRQDCRGSRVRCGRDGTAQGVCPEFGHPAGILTAEGDCRDVCGHLPLLALTVRLRPVIDAMAQPAMTAVLRMLCLPRGSIAQHGDC